MYKIELKDDGYYHAFRKEKWLMFFSKWTLITGGRFENGDCSSEDGAMHVIEEDKKNAAYERKRKQEAKEYKTVYIK